jgi:hypothetical protein
VAIKIKLKHSSTANKAPLPSDLDAGELALNTNAASPAAYIKDSAGNIVKLAGAGAIGGTAATETAAGIVELATAAETTTGTDATRAVHPAGLKVELDKKAPLDSPALTGTPTAPTAAAGTNTTQLATTAFVAAAADWARTGTTLAPKTAGDVVEVSAGTAALPGLTPVGDPNTGIYSPGADRLSISTGGTERVAVTAAGRVGIGTSTPATALHVSGSGTQRLRITGTDAANAILSLDAASTYSNYIEYGVSASTPLYFRDVTAGADRMVIDTAGRVLVGKTTATANGGDLQISKGITFPAAAIGSTDPNTLDDYEEGTFTPIVSGTATAGAGTYTAQAGYYTKVGNLVRIYLQVKWTAHTGAGDVSISLPFQVATAWQIGSCALTQMTYTGTPFAQLPGSGTAANITLSVSGASKTNLSMSALGEVEVFAVYQAA